MILTVAIPTPLRRFFDYLPPEDGVKSVQSLMPGVRVKVSFGARILIGLIVDIKQSSEQPEDKLKPILDVIDQSPLVDKHLLDLFIWTANYYQHPVGDALFSTLPSLLRKGNAVPSLLLEFWQLTPRAHGLSDDSLKRAGKQKALVQLLASSGPILAAEALNSGFTRETFRNLVKKGLAEMLKRESNTESSEPLMANPGLPLRDEQRQALDKIDLEKYSATVLFGDTGTGKTEVYLQAIEKVLEKGRQALLLVPEINLTPQTLARIRQRFNAPVQAMHSNLTDRERLQAWAEARAGRARIIVGTRSAVFTPLPDIGIIILDEEHDPSFKQQEGFRYSARDVAVMRARNANIPVVLGSATPSLESLQNCRNGRYLLSELRQRSHNVPPEWVLVDLKATKLRGGLAATTSEAISSHLARGQQVLVFLNRRGYAPVMLCHNCGWQAHCKHCSTKLTVHLGNPKLICHHCETQMRLPANCPACGSTKLLFSGQGTERCEEVLTQIFPGTQIIRVDRDSTRRKGAMDKAIGDIQSNKPAILLGTQMLAKGHHFPNVSLAVLLDVDGGLFSTDFRAIERTVQMIIQVAGRAGRGDSPGQIYLQSHFCDHPVIADIVRGDYRHFAENLLQERDMHRLPPFAHLAYFRCDSRQPHESEEYLKRVRSIAEQLMPPSNTFSYLGPLPGAIEKRRDHYRFTLLINAVNRSALSRGLAELCRQLEQERTPSGLKWSLDVDPMDML